MRVSEQSRVTYTPVTTWSTCVMVVPSCLLQLTRFPSLPLLRRSPLLLHHVQPLKTCVQKVWSSWALPSLATHWANSLPLLLLPIYCQIPLSLTLCFIAV